MKLSEQWLRRLSLAGSVVLGAVLLLAAWGKVLDPVAFAEEIRRQGLAWVLPASAWSVLFVAFEVGLGVLLLLGVRHRWVLWPSTALVALFLFLNGRAYWRFSQGLIDASESCGCFGNLMSRTPAEAFWQDLLLLVPPLALAWLASSRGPRLDWRAGVAGVLALGTLGFAYQAPRLPLDDLATRLRPGVEVSEICAGAEDGALRICLDALFPELTRGDHLVVISEVENPALLAAIHRLNARAAGAPGVWLLTASPEAARQAFFWQSAPAFEVREVPAELLRPLYRTTPRSFSLRDGTVAETWPGIPGESGAADSGT